MKPPLPAMKLNYFPETDSLYIDLSEKPSVESQEVSAGVVLELLRGSLSGWSGSTTSVSRLGKSGSIKVDG